MQLKRKLHETDSRLNGVVCTIPSATVTQAMAAMGTDFVIIDMEHGAVDHASAHAMIAATQGTDCAPLVRIAEISEPQVKRVLDLGAEGIVFPLVETEADAVRAVKSLRYPPVGTRGFGPFIAQSRWHSSLPSFQRDTERKVVCCLLIETVAAIENIDAICAVEGVDFLVLAAFDLSTALGCPGQFDHTDFKAACATVEAAARAANIPLGGNALEQTQADALFARGYRLIAGFDLLWLRARAGELVGWC